MTNTLTQEEIQQLATKDGFENVRAYEWGEGFTVETGYRNIWSHRFNSNGNFKVYKTQKTALNAAEKLVLQRRMWS